MAERIQSACLCAILLAGLAFADEFEQGVHYTKIPIPSKTLDPSRVEVVEVFSYACPHCYNFRPLLDAWKNRLPEDVAFRRVHAVFSPSWGRLAQAFHVAESLEALERIHVPLFEAIHEHRLDMSQTDLLARLFEQRAGVDKETFQSAFTSFETQRRVGESMAAVRVYRIVAVPSLVVEGKYVVDTKGLSALVEMLDVVDFLIDKARKERATSESESDSGNN